MMYIGIVTILLMVMFITMSNEGKVIMDDMIDFVDRKLAKRQRRKDIKKRYGFDDSYDKYIA